ncbi:hypothetical protein [Bacillus atrophaeus]|uniref:hypothetical protein n=1 Tax=Bacillus atrophaeus TaxID=1452 RepID=UPI001BAA5063|nr:hypothetical protein [Bacillus atrophaeus]MED4856267.1 hypothetical protein [Bacillus atrophaeus]QUF65361.1 hypothetical protein KCX77_20335 [Bacillus atrophaeus]
MNAFTVKDRSERRAIIDSEIKISKRVESTLFRGKMRECPVIRIPIDLPIYRMKNGRTQVEQFLYIREQNESNDFFKNGEENQTVQFIQHQFLLKLSKDNKGPIYNELEHVTSQRERLLITSDGVIVNGNRREAAMRDLFLKDPRVFKEFSHVDVVVLPPEATEKDIEMIETELQLKPETKLDYGWIERRLKLRLHVNDLKIPRDEIKKVYRFKREDEINVELQQLALAEEFLEKYLERPYAYREVTKSEQIFKDLQKALSGKSGEEEEIRRLLGFLLAKESENLGDRVYDFRQLFGNRFEDVLDKYAEEQGITLNPETAIDLFTEFDEDDDEDPLAGLEVEKPSKYSPLKEIFNNQGKTKDTAENLIKILESVKQQQKEETIKMIGLKNSQEALRLLNEIDLGTSDPLTHQQIQGQLKAVLNVANKLLADLMVSNPK